MKREDFVFTIGYDGETAIIDGQARKRYGRLSTRELLAEGLFKPALCSAIFDNDEEAVTAVISAYNEHTGTAIEQTEDLKRVFGVFDVPSHIAKTKIL